MYVFRLAQINTFHHCVCVCVCCSLHRVALQVKHKIGARLSFSLRTFYCIFFSLRRFIQFAVAGMLLATGCAWTHSFALTSVNQVKIDIFMLVSRCVGDGDGDGAVVAYIHIHTYIIIHFDFDLMVIILQSKTVIFILARAHTWKHTYTYNLG